MQIACTQQEIEELIAAPTPERVTEALDCLAVVKAIGNTPLLPLHRLASDFGLPPAIQLWLKAEWTNPGGSIKDRPALAIIRQGMIDGKLGFGRVLLDATSGNTGIAYAMLGAALGIPVELIVPGSASTERKRILATYGAELILSDPYDGSDGAIRLTRERAANDPDRYFYADQYNNAANIATHTTTTGPELWFQTGGHITHLIAGLGTTGTLMGTGRYLKERNPRVKLVGVQPADAFHGIEGLKHLPTAIVPGIYDANLVDQQIGIETDEAFAVTRRLARVEGLFAGASTGAALSAAVRVGRQLAARGQSGHLVAVAPDGGAKYLSTGLWDGS